MCGIAGLFLKDKSLEPELGALLSEMLVTLTDRGPDSAGIAIYGAADAGAVKITVQSKAPGRDFPRDRARARPRRPVRRRAGRKDTHAW